MVSSAKDVMNDEDNNNKTQGTRIKREDESRLGVTFEIMMKTTSHIQTQMTTKTRELTVLFTKGILTRIKTITR